MSQKGRVLMAISGGIDSSIASVILHEQGYEVIGITLKTWDHESSGNNCNETACCNIESINDARRIAVKLGIKHYVLDVIKEFENIIVNNFINEYLSGRTPNPCILCNTHIKWGLLLEKADMLDCEFIATGHYAKIRNENNRYVLYKGIDESKEQSYVLWGLTQNQLKRTIFPLGNMLKKDIKKIAENSGYKYLSEKKESYDICFIPNDDYRTFLNYKVENLSEKYCGGNFISTDGKILGKHKGYPFYTIGQRKGLNIAAGIPLYVIEINIHDNTIMLGTRDELTKNNLLVKNYNLIKYDKVPENIEVLTKIRYKDKGTMSYLKHKDSQINVFFNNPVFSVAPGQSAVFYENDDVVGGGIIIR